MKTCRTMHWAVAWLCLAIGIGVVAANSTDIHPTPAGAVTDPPTQDSATKHEGMNETTGHGDGTTHAGEGDHDEDDHPHEGSEHEVERYEVAHIDFKRVQTPYIIGAWIILACIAKLLFHFNNKLSSMFPESCMLIILGVILGIALYFSGEKGYEMNTDVFFLYLLPPIILEAGYFMPNRDFFENVGSILLYAVIGTLFNTLCMGFTIWGLSETTGAGWIPMRLDMLQCLVFSSLLSAVDPVAVLAVFEEIHVNEMLHIIVFGESLLNDGVTVVLYHMFEAYAEIGQENIIAVDIVLGVVSFLVVVIFSTAIGMLIGFVTAFMTRFTAQVRIVEPIIVLVMGYLSYLTAEVFHLSGILACTACGISMRKYVEKNVAEKSRTTIKYFLKMLASTCETIIFMLLGVSTVVDDHEWDTAFVLLTLLFCLIYRTIGVIVLTFLVNQVRVIPIGWVDQFIMAYGGLRGAIAFSLVVLLDKNHFPQRNLFITTTVVVVYFTVFVQGATIKPLVNFLKVKKSDKRDPTMNEQINNKMIDAFMAGIEDITGKMGNNLIRQKWQKFDNQYLKRWIIEEKSLKHRGHSIVNIFNKLNEHDASEYLKRRGSFVMPENGGVLPTAESFAQMYSNASPSVAKDLHLLDRELASRGGGGGAGGGYPERKEPEQAPRMNRSDSFFYHVMDDALVKADPRRDPIGAESPQTERFRRHMVREQSVGDISQLADKARLRKLISQLQRDRHNQELRKQAHPDFPQSSSSSSSSHSHKPYNTTSTTEAETPPIHRLSGPRKSVSFGDVRQAGGLKVDMEDLESLGGSESSGGMVLFTLGQEQEMKAEKERKRVRAAAAEPTTAESSLPWKRTTGREGMTSPHGMRDSEAQLAWRQGKDRAGETERKGQEDREGDSRRGARRGQEMDRGREDEADRRESRRGNDDRGREEYEPEMRERESRRVNDKNDDRGERGERYKSGRRQDEPRKQERRGRGDRESHDEIPTDTLPWRRGDDDERRKRDRSEKSKKSERSDKSDKKRDKSKSKDRGRDNNLESKSSTRERSTSRDRNHNHHRSSNSRDGSDKTQKKSHRRRRQNSSSSPSKSSRRPRPESEALPWRQARSEEAVPSPSVIAGSGDDGHSLRSRGKVAAAAVTAESHHSEWIHHMIPVIDPDAEPREMLGPRDQILQALDDDAESIDSSVRVQQWLESSETASLPREEDEEGSDEWGVKEVDEEAEEEGEVGYSKVKGAAQDTSTC